MRNPRVTSLLLAALLGAGAWGVWSRVTLESTEAGALEASPAASMKTATRAGVLPPIAPHRVVEFLETAPATVPGRARIASAPLELGADAAALTAETAALQLLAADSELELQSLQWTALATATLRIQAIRQAYEATIATTTPGEAGRFRVEIPAYAKAGDALREKFHAELREQLGDANAAEVLAQIGARLEGRFAGFGVSVQTLDIAVDRSGSGDDVVTRTVKYWNSAERGERLTTRRETHFPGREDPTGELWRPLLALVAGGAE